MDIIYTFIRNEQTQKMELGKTHPQVDEWVAADQQDRWAILTAENPLGEEFPHFINKQRTQVLREQLMQSDLHWVEGIGEAEGYPSEVVFLIWGLDLEEFALLAYEMSQTAVVTGVLGGYAEVVTLQENTEFDSGVSE